MKGGETVNRLESICSIWACVNGTLAIVISIISLRQKKPPLVIPARNVSGGRQKDGGSQGSPSDPTLLYTDCNAQVNIINGMPDGGAAGRCLSPARHMAHCGAHRRGGNGNGGADHSCQRPKEAQLMEDKIKLQRIREEQGYSRAAFARATGIPLRTLESWEGRVRLPRDVYQLLKAARVLGCHIEDIIEDIIEETE